MAEKPCWEGIECTDPQCTLSHPAGRVAQIFNFEFQDYEEEELVHEDEDKVQIEEVEEDNEAVPSYIYSQTRKCPNARACTREDCQLQHPDGREIDDEELSMRLQNEEELSMQLQMVLLADDLDIVNNVDDFNINDKRFNVKYNIEDLSDQTNAIGYNALDDDDVDDLVKPFQDMISSRYGGNCSVCFDELKLIATIRCDHAPDVCSKCILMFHQTKQTETKKPFIQCATSGCINKFTHEEYKKFATPEAFELYERLLTMTTLMQQKDFVMCSAPDCTNGQFHDGGDSSNIVTCNSCGFKSCFVCRDAWHPNLLCREAKDMHNNNSNTKLINELTKPCPQCSYRFDKSEGCDKMTCKECGYEFCWLCGASYRAIIKTSNDSHSPSCKYHTNNLPA